MLIDHHVHAENLEAVRPVRSLVVRRDVFILRRLAAVARFLPNGSKSAPLQGPKRPAPLDEALARLGHEVYFGDSDHPAPRRAGQQRRRNTD